MSAVEKYESMKQDRLGSESPILASVIADYADAAIAELEAEGGRIDEMHRRQINLLISDRTKAEAALAKRAVRHCETCQRAYTDCSRRIVLVNDDAVDVDSCSEWSARAEEGCRDA